MFIVNLTISVPPPKFYVQLNPIQVVFDVDSCLWLNSFGLNLYQSLLSSKQDLQKASQYTYIDVKIEAILPRVRRLFYNNCTIYLNIIIDN